MPKTIDDPGQPKAGGFQPIVPWGSPDLSISRRNLPHLYVPGATYFVTFRCRQGRYLAPPHRTIVLETIRYWDGRGIELDGAVVMPDHTHILVRPTRENLLSRFLQCVKGSSARKINLMLGTGGSVWLDENFDRIVRSKDEWEKNREYIRQNPVRKGLVKTPEEYPWLYIKPTETK